MKSRILKELPSGRKLKKGNLIRIPEHGEFIVEGFYSVKVTKEYTVAVRRVSDGKVYMLGEESILKYRVPHLRIVK